MEAPSREQFVDLLFAHVREKFPLVKLSKATEQPFSVSVNGNIASLENLYRIASLRPEQLDRQIDRWMVELLRASEGSPDQAKSFDDLRERIMPMVLSGTVSDVHSGTMVSQPFLDTLHIAYAVDNDRTIAYIPQGVLERWQVDMDNLHETAINNLIRKSEAINAQAAQDEDGNVNLVIFQTMDGYDASRILLPSLHERLKPYLGSPFVAGIPNRDILICFRNEKAMVDRLHRQIMSDYKQMPHQITDQLLLVTPDGIAPQGD
jgi:uncharacterized protein YtpQ (UPF0354 family)